MKFFAKDFPQKLNSSILMSEVVGKKVKLKQHGKEFMGLCPFHNEKSPSFTVNDQKGFYHCFGCQAHGNAINFLMQTDGFEFRESVVKLAEDFGIDIPWQEARFDSKQKTIVDEQQEIVARICDIFQENLGEASGSAAREYLKNRGFSKKIIMDFGIGYAKYSYDDLHERLTKEGFREEIILKTGLINKNNSGKLYDKFRNRVIFPIFDTKNQPIAFGGRVLDDSLPKYMNSAETDIFKKGQTLYNINNARKAIFTEKFAVVVEGYIDAIALAGNAIENVVAGLGTALSQDHIKNLFRLTDRIVLCFDGDSAGIKAAKRVSELSLDLIGVNKNINFAFLPGKLDPDDYIKKYGAKALSNLFKNETISHSQALVDFTLMDLKVKEGSAVSAEKKAKIESGLMRQAELIKDNLTKKYFSQFFRDFLFKVGRSGKKYGKKGEKANVFSKIGETQQILNLDYDDIFARNIISLLIKCPRLADYSDEKFNLREISFENDDLSEIKDLIIDYIEEENEISEKNLLLVLENYSNTSYNRSIKALLKKDFIGFEKLMENEINKKTRLLLLKNLLLQVEKLYKQALSKIDEIGTHQSAISDDKVTEIFTYKHSVEQEILELESELIGGEQ